HPLAELGPRGFAHSALRAAPVFPARAALVGRLPARARPGGADRVRAAARALDLEHRAALRAGRARRPARAAAPARSPARERPLLLGERPALAPRGRGARRRPAQGGARAARLRHRFASGARRTPVGADPEIQGRRRKVHERRRRDARRGLHPPDAGRPERAQGTRKREQTMTTPKPTPEQFAQAAKVAAAMRAEVGKALIGQPEVIDAVLCALLAGGHVLVEGVPGLGKTLLVKALARTVSGSFGRIQFTPDLMPADVTGHTLYDPKNQVFTTRRGPVFVNLLLADEINRAPAKTQAALLEVMQEAQVTIEGEAHKLEPPFMVLATQNPIEQEGTYALPEAQLDRFLLKVKIDYPSQADELALVRHVTEGKVGDKLEVEQVQSLVKPSTVTSLQAIAASLRADDAVLDYAIRLVRATRSWAGVVAGAGPRGAISIVRAARAAALLGGRDFVTPDDVKRMALPALRHRIMPSPELELEGRDTDAILKGLLEKIEAPRK